MSVSLIPGQSEDVYPVLFQPVGVLGCLRVFSGRGASGRHAKPLSRLKALVGEGLQLR